jgi:hypothetical protein
MNVHQITKAISTIVSTHCNDNMMVYHYSKSLEILNNSSNILGKDTFSDSPDMIEFVKINILKKILKKLIPNEPLYKWENEIVQLEIGRSEKIADLLELSDTDFNKSLSDFDEWYDEDNKIRIEEYYSNKLTINDFVHLFMP